jgi:hypothetical protein
MSNLKEAIKARLLKQAEFTELDDKVLTGILKTRELGAQGLGKAKEYGSAGLEWAKDNPGQAGAVMGAAAIPMGAVALKRAIQSRVAPKAAETPGMMAQAWKGFRGLPLWAQGGIGLGAAGLGYMGLSGSGDSSRDRKRQIIIR